MSVCFDAFLLKHDSSEDCSRRASDQAVIHLLLEVLEALLLLKFSDVREQFPQKVLRGGSLENLPDLDLFP